MPYCSHHSKSHFHVLYVSRQTVNSQTRLDFSGVLSSKYVCTEYCPNKTLSKRSKSRVAIAHSARPNYLIHDDDTNIDDEVMDDGITRVVLLVVDREKKDAKTNALINQAKFLELSSITGNTERSDSHC